MILGGRPAIPIADVLKGNAVYRLYAADGSLLYVGSTQRPAQARIACHRGRRWWPEVAYATIEGFPSIAEARQAEVSAIQAELPRYNVTGRDFLASPATRPARGGFSSRTAQPYPDLARLRLELGMRSWSNQRLANAADIGASSAARAVAGDRVALATIAAVDKAFAEYPATMTATGRFVLDAEAS